MALNADPPARQNEIPDNQRLRRGPAYGTTKTDDTLQAAAEDWPTYRHDATRSGRASTQVDPELLLGWQQKVGGRLTAPVVARGRIYLASTDTHTIHSLDAATGAEVWKATFDGPIDSPPTIHEGLVLCGCRDGSVYALRADDGTRAWRFFACPVQRRIVSRGQLESVWPVNGSVLVENGTAYFAAGKSSYLDGGIRLYGLDPHTGQMKFQKVLSSRASDGSEILDAEGVDGCLSGILSSNGQRLFMRHRVFDLTGQSKQERIVHLHGADGFLSEDTTHRLLWTYAPMFTSPHQGAFYDMRLSRTLFPSGRILSEGEETIYGFGQNHYNRMSADPGGQWALFAASKQIDVPLDLTAKEYRSLAMSKKKSVQFRWWKRIPIRARALVKTDDVLFVAGPIGSDSTSPDALEGNAEAMLLAVSPDDGRVLARMKLPSTPVWDGMAAAAGKLFVSLANGQVLCLWPIDSGMPGTPLSVSARR
jgi:hypothetical protein